MIQRPVVYGLFATLLGAAACQEAAIAPTATAAPVAARFAADDAAGAPRGPIARILARADALGLSGEQVSRLTAIGEALEAKNAPLHERIRAILGDRPAPGERRQMTQAEREAMRAKMEQARPLFEQVRENSRAAFDEVRTVLTAEQQAKIREALRDGARRGGPGGGPGRMGRGPDGPGSPIARLLENASALGLSPDQVSRLTAIQSRLDAKTAPLRAQVKAIVGERPAPGERREMTQAEREAMRAKMEQARPILEQIREASRAAFEEARSVLTAEQQAKVRERMGGDRAPRRGRGGPGGRAG